MSYTNKNIFKVIFAISIFTLSFFVNSADNRVLAACGNDTNCFPPVQGSCSANVSRGQTGDIITWTADAYDGNGYYSYDWSGTDGLSSFYPVIDKRYDTFGTKNASVQITSYGVTITRTCSVSIEDNTNYYNNNLNAYCTASPNNPSIGQVVNWNVTPSGGNGYYTYSWNGSDGIYYGSNQTVYKSYDTAGTKTATVQVYSNGQSRSVTCSANVQNSNGIYLSSIPATGISPNLKTVLFSSGVIIWSAFLGYLFIARRNEKLKEREVLESLK